MPDAERHRGTAPAAGAELLVLDEPTEGMDAEGRLLVREEVAARRAGGGTVLLVSHDLGEVGRLCDRVAVLAEGRPAFVGPTSALTSDPATGAVRPLEDAVCDLARRAAA